MKNHPIFPNYGIAKTAHCDREATGSCVSRREPTLAGTSMFTSCVKICTHMKCEVEHNVGIWDWGIYGLTSGILDEWGKLLFCQGNSEARQYNH